MTQVKIDEVLCLMCNVAAKISAHDTVPGRVIFLVKFLLDIGSNVLLYVVLLHSLRGTVDGILLHVLRHVCILDHCLPVRHGDTSQRRVLAGPRGSSDGLRQSAGRAVSLRLLRQQPPPPRSPAPAGPDRALAPPPSALELSRPPALRLAPADPPAPRWRLTAPLRSADRKSVV